MDKPRNILFITTDQQRRDSLPCYGLDFVQTPHLDRLAREGVVFDLCTSVSPVCQPARASMITGQYPHVHGVPDNFRWIRPDSPTLGRLFSEAGWHTAAIGKMHFHPWDNPEGFQYRVIAEDKRHIFRNDHWTRFLKEHGYEREHPAAIPGYAENLGAVVAPYPEEMHIDSFIGREAVRWIEDGPREPFLSWISFNSPHDPYDPPANLAGLYREAPIPEPVGLDEDLSLKPAYQREGVEFYRDNLLYLTDYSAMTPQQVRRMREYYLATVTLVDRQIGRILDALEQKGLLERTLVVFSSDHGDTLGDHGLPFKSTYYEGALMVPLIARGPGAAAGRRCRSFVDWLDLYATFFSLAGLPLPDHAQGRDISRLLADPDGPGREEAYSELLGSAMVRTRTHKLVLCDDGSGELYDLTDVAPAETGLPRLAPQPLEVRNRFDDPDLREVRRDLTGRLVSHLLAHSRVRSFGGGRHGADPERAARFAEIREKRDRGAFPGL